MHARAAVIFPFVIAVLLPPAGLVIALLAAANDRELGLRIGAVAILAAVVWALVLLG